MADAGKAMMLYKGVYDSTIEYEILDVVNYNGSLYISKINNNLDYEPTLDETKWQLFLEGGTSENIKVTDTQGIVGDAGSSSFVQTLLDGIAEKVVKIISGSQVVEKAKKAEMATNDSNGKNIASTYVPKINIINTVEAIDANTSSENIAGALAMKSLKSDFANSLSKVINDIGAATALIPEASGFNVGDVLTPIDDINKFNYFVMQINWRNTELLRRRYYNSTHDILVGTADQNGENSYLVTRNIELLINRSTGAVTINKALQVNAQTDGNYIFQMQNFSLGLLGALFKC